MNRTDTLRRGHRHNLKPNGMAFMSPALIIYTFVVGLPSIMTLGYAFTDWRIGGTAVFAGFSNFQKMFEPTQWVVWSAVKNNLLWMVLMVIINITLAIVVSGCLLNVSRRARQLLRVLFFVPVVLPRTVVCRIWMWLYNPITGLTPILKQFGICFPGIGDPATVIYAIALVGVWCWWGFPLVIFLSSLEQIDPVYYEAAELEGANRLQVFTGITLPLMRATLIFVFVLTIISSFQIFDLIYIMTNGGPGRASEVLSTLIYKNGILQFDAGYGSALAVLQLLISSVGIVAYSCMQKKGMEDV